MGLELQYENALMKLLNDKKINAQNRTLFQRVLEYEEKKLRRKNNLIKLDDSCYKTLYGYVVKFRNVNRFFKNKILTELTKEQIKKVLEDFQDEKILNQNKKPFKDKKSYYTKVFRSKLFEFAGKKHLVQEVMTEEFFSMSNESKVEFIEESDVKRIVQTAIQPEHKLFLQLCWDVGENPFSILQLVKNDFTKRINDNHEPEYHINLRKEILKRSRTARTEITNFKETVELLDLVLKDRKENQRLFNFELRQAEKMFDRAIKILNIKTLPNKEKPRLRVLRKSMVCYLINQGWQHPDLNARLGHKPSSTEIDKYLTYFAIDRKKPKEKLFNNNLEQVSSEVEEIKLQNKLKDKRINDLTEKYESLMEDKDHTEKMLNSLMKYLKDRGVVMEIKNSKGKLDFKSK